MKSAFAVIKRAREMEEGNSLVCCILLKMGFINPHRSFSTMH